MDPIMFLPSSLLFHGRINLPVAVRRGECARACLAQDWDGLEAIAQQVISRWNDDGDWQSAAVALVHLGDDAIKGGNPSLAHAYYKRAKFFFSVRVSPAQRQNEAAALYGMIIADVALAERAIQVDITMEQIAQARKLLACASRDWSVQGNEAQVARCREANARMKETLSRWLNIDDDDRPGRRQIAGHSEGVTVEVQDDEFIYM